MFDYSRIQQLIKEKDCEEVREIYGLMKEFSDNAAPGKYLAETFPPLSKLPIGLQWWRKSVEPLYQRQVNIWMKFWNNLKVQLDLKTAPECFVKQVIETDYQKLGVSELQAAFLAGSMFPVHASLVTSHLLVRYAN